MALLPVAPVKLPTDLGGQSNGKLNVSLLTIVHGGSTLHHLAARAWNALVASASAAGFEMTYTYGGCYRNYASQVLLFNQRYTTTVLRGRPIKVWNGVVYYQKPNTAMAAVPGTSNHGWGLAVDTALDGDLADGVGPDDAISISQALLTWMLANVARFGFSWEAQSEPWHIRYIAGDAIPAAVLLFELGDDLKPTPPKPDPTPTPDPAWKDPDMATARLIVPGRNAEFFATGERLPDGSVHCVQIVWSRPGGSPFYEDHKGAPNVIVQPTSIETLKRDLILVGNPADIQDSTHTWTAADFAGVS